MTINEKLEHFYDAAVEAARTEAQQKLDMHKEKLAKTFAEHKRAAIENADAQVKAEAENAKREINKALSAEQLSIKRQWTKKQNDLKAELFVEVKNQLEAFMKTSAYEDFLCKKINEAKAFAGDDRIIIYVDSADESRVHSLTARTGMPLVVAESSFMGGIKATIPDKNILIDDSFLEVFDALQKEFKFDGGPNHE